ncbi:hypothetical protein O6H91_17G017500 [Diphasiastrum complanatum]|uniref:Uncharacterized protein n=1 Tax=Diphasiastrum complanatum TaxID=34168 RepID=A0ACC2B4J1_DIPCM|nr:hypothetical protein O6H91_17G017500 [Diphasiastrum complanatum]
MNSSTSIIKTSFAKHSKCFFVVHKMKIFGFLVSKGIACNDPSKICWLSYAKSVVSKYCSYETCYNAFTFMVHRAYQVHLFYELDPSLTNMLLLLVAILGFETLAIVFLLP